MAAPASEPNPALARELGENGWRAARHYTWEAEAEKLEALYRQLAADRGRNPG